MIIDLSTSREARNYQWKMNINYIEQINLLLSSRVYPKECLARAVSVINDESPIYKPTKRTSLSKLFYFILNTHSIIHQHEYKIFFSSK